MILYNKVHPPANVKVPWIISLGSAWGIITHGPRRPRPLARLKGGTVLEVVL